MDHCYAPGSAAAKPVAAPAGTVTSGALNHDLCIGLEADALRGIEPVGRLNQANGATADEVVNLQRTGAPGRAKTLRDPVDERKVASDQLVASCVVHPWPLFRGRSAQS